MPSINHLLTIAILLSAALLPISCNKQRDKQGEQYSTHRAEMETIAQQRLATAREQLKEDNCQAAKSSIEAMRHDCYLALTAHEQNALLTSREGKVAIVAHGLNTTLGGLTVVFF